MPQIRGKQLENAAISGNKIAAGAILGGHIAAGTVTQDHLSNSIISGNKITANAILQGHVANGYMDLSSTQTLSGVKLFNQLRVIGNPTISTDVVNKGYVDGLGIGAGSSPTIANKNMTAIVTSANGDKACADPIAAAPATNSYIAVLVNGVQVVLGSDNTKECFFGQGDSTAPRPITDVTSGDTIRWNGGIAGYQLDGVDRIDLNYNT